MQGKNQKQKTRKIDFTLDAPGARSVAVAGTFNDWDPKNSPMHSDGNGRWNIPVSLPPGRYEYRFVVDGVWMSDPSSQQSVPNPFGDQNSLIVV